MIKLYRKSFEYINFKRLYCHETIRISLFFSLMQGNTVTNIELTCIIRGLFIPVFFCVFLKNIALRACLAGHSLSSDRIALSSYTFGVSYIYTTAILL